jgi:hypothetical protein
MSPSDSPNADFTPPSSSPPTPPSERPATASMPRRSRSRTALDHDETTRSTCPRSSSTTARSAASPSPRRRGRSGPGVQTLVQRGERLRRRWQLKEGEGAEGPSRHPLPTAKARRDAEAAARVSATTREFRDRSSGVVRRASCTRRLLSTDARRHEEPPGDAAPMQRRCSRTDWRSSHQRSSSSGVRGASPSRWSRIPR